MLINFLKKNEVLKAKIMMIINEEKEISIKVLANLINKSIVSTKRILNSLSEDLTILNQDTFIIENENQQIQIKFPNHLTNELLNKDLYRFYVEKSTEFIIFKKILVEGETNMLSLCQKINVSQSYCYSIVNKLNSYLKKYHIKIVINHFKLELIGDEKDIFFFQYLIIESFNILHVKYDVNTLSQNQLKLNKNLEINLKPLDQSLMNFMFQTYNKRYNYLNNLKISRKDVLEILTVMTDINNLLNQTKMDKQLNKNHQLLFFNLFTRCIISNIDSIENRNQIIEKCLLFKNNQIIINSIALTDEIISMINCHDTEEQQLLYNDILYLVILYTCYIDSFSDDFSAIIKHDFQKKIMDFIPVHPTDLENRVSIITKKHSKVFKEWNRNTLVSFENLMIKVINTLVLSRQRMKFNIMIDSYPVLYDGLSIEKYIHSFFSEKMVCFVENFEEADLIISDKSTTQKHPVPVFTFYDNYSKSRWDALFMLITEKSREKLQPMTS